MFKEIINIYNYKYIVNDREESVFIKFKRTLAVYFIIMLGVLLISSIILGTDYIVKNFFHLKSLIKIDSNGMEKIFLKYGRTRALIAGCILVPTIEELLFRVWLDLKKNNIALFFASVIFIISGGKLAALSLNITFSIRIILAACTFILVRYLATDVIGKIEDYQKYIILVSIISFGLVHISNYSPIYWKIIYLYPIYVLPQLIMAVGLTYTRFKSGIFWSIFLHCLINSISLILTFQY